MSSPNIVADPFRGEKSSKADVDKERQRSDEFHVGPAIPLREDEEPSEEELRVLRKVPAAMPWVAIAMCIVELAERASYHGTRKAFANFVRGGLPLGGNGLGAVAKGAAGANQTSGALGLGSVAASAIGSTFTFLSYVIPILGGILSDTRWGRFKTIFIGVVVGFFGHIVLVVSTLPGVINHQAALAPFIIGIVVLAFGAGFIKPSLGPLLCDQSPIQRPTLQTLSSGEKVVLDPQATVQRYFLVFYWCINVGSFWMIVTSYTERLVGFWLAFLLPTAIYLVVPIVFLYARNRLYFAPPQGSVVYESFYVIREIFRRNGLKVFKGGQHVWDSAKPSYIIKADGVIDEDKVFWDDQFVEEIRQSINACSVSWVLVIFYLADGFIGNMENDQSAAMILNHIPNDITSNFNPLSIIIATPIITYGLYPLFERWGHPIKPMARFSIGFALGAAASIIGAIVQWKVYQTSPCGWYATDCEFGVSGVSLAWQIPQIVLPAIGEVFVSVTSYELAYTRAPARMKSLVYAIVLFNQAISAAIGLALSGVIRDPWLIWPYVALAAANFICIFWVPWYYRHLNTPLSSFADRERAAGKKEQVAGLVPEGAGELTAAGEKRGVA